VLPSLLFVAFKIKIYLKWGSQGQHEVGKTAITTFADLQIQGADDQNPCAVSSQMQLRSDFPDGLHLIGQPVTAVKNIVASLGRYILYGYFHPFSVTAGKRLEDFEQSDNQVE